MRVPSAYRIEYAPDALMDLDYHRGSGAARVRAEVRARLEQVPLRDTTNNGPMRSNVLGVTRRLRVQPFRVYYEVKEDRRLVRILAVCKKEREKVYRRGKEIDLDD
ncbi:MAG: type II toxin-antitoxin system RelE/ParE family toxin [Chloroflexi bacterium]|nr:type II toxin-antitoxin system RelE/ParE family toxin [Chloroflexota bacterium]